MRIHTLWSASLLLMAQDRGLTGGLPRSSLVGLADGLAGGLAGGLARDLFIKGSIYCG